jgi:membrane-associated protease RseP (regulator of RpoE activity)
MDEYVPSPERAEPFEPADYYVAVPPRRRVLPLVLFVLTCLSTFFTGTVWSGHAELFGSAETAAWLDGLKYMLAVMGILLAHEMGHFVQALRHHVPASLPYFIPMPFSPVGTMGAVIGMQGSKADRRELFDIGISGPLAGLVVALPIAWYGVLIAEPYVGPVGDALEACDPLLFQLLIRYLRPDVPTDQVFRWNPYYMAAWVGMLITGLNMLPLSQLDGGHISYALFGKWAHRLARLVVIGALYFVLSYEQYGWILMIAVILFIGVDHPPTSNDRAPLGVTRRVLGYASLAIPIFCLAPIPVRELAGP